MSVGLATAVGLYFKISYSCIICNNKMRDKRSDIIKKKNSEIN